MARGTAPDPSENPSAAERRERLICCIRDLPTDQLDRVEGLLMTWLDAQRQSSTGPARTPPPVSGVAGKSIVPASQTDRSLPSGTTAGSVSKDWPHAPVHRLALEGTYIVTGATYRKEHIFRDPARLELLESQLLSHANEFGWDLEAWAVFSNHYHFVAHASPGCRKLDHMLKSLHGETAIAVNKHDGAPGRMVWFNFRDTRLTFEQSYLARLNYVHQNAVRHGLVPVANQYRWCSAAWFERTARPSQVKTIYSLKSDRIKVLDDFDPVF